jgi:hypothetical protein
VSVMPIDFTEPNLQRIRNITLHSMNVAEMVDSDRSVEWKFHFADSIWWREVKPFFYQPADVATKILPGSQRPNVVAAMGGYYHMVPDGAPANGKIVFNEIKEPAGFDLSAIRKTKRNMIRRGLRALRIEKITDPELLLGEGFKIYLDWEKRTNGVLVKRSDPQKYARWINALMNHPHELILGAFLENRLTAWIVARATGERADLVKAFSDSEFNHLEPTSTLIYAYILICGQNSQIKVACDGLRSLKPSLEDYKSALGFRHVEYPAYIHLRRMIKPLVRRFLPAQYKRLMGEYAV